MTGCISLLVEICGWRDRSGLKTRSYKQRRMNSGFGESSGSAKPHFMGCCS